MTKRRIQFVPTRGARLPARIAGVAMAAALLAACSAEVNVRGNQPDPETLALVKPGQQTREQVIELLGSPTAVGTFDKSTIYYISQRTKVVTYHKPEVLSRTVVAISFDQNGRVAEVKTLGLEDGKEIQLVERTTPTPGRQFTLLQQLLGNLGRFESGEEQRAQ